jgi:hypothetical protein
VKAKAAIASARDASKLLTEADPFTEAVSKGSKTFYRARFAGLDQNSAKAACRSLERAVGDLLHRHQKPMATRFDSPSRTSCQDGR